MPADEKANPVEVSLLGFEAIGHLYKLPFALSLSKGFLAKWLFFARCNGAGRGQNLSQR